MYYVENDGSITMANQRENYAPKNSTVERFSVSNGIPTWVLIMLVAATVMIASYFFIETKKKIEKQERLGFSFY